MKIKSLLFLLLLVIVTLDAKQTGLPETKEIIGSGIISVNSTRNFSTDSNTLYYLDEQAIDFITFEIIGSGFKSAFTVLDDVSSSLESGTVNAIELITNLQGPVTSVSPLEILEQSVLVTSDTVNALTQPMQLNGAVAVSGYLSSNNSMMGTRLMPVTNSDWKIRGIASEVGAQSFKIGSLLVNRNGEQLLDCQSGLNNAQLVEVKMSADANYQAGSAINTLISIKCLNLNQVQGQMAVLPSVVQGFVSETVGQGFWLNDIHVLTDQNTLYENGEQTFIDLSVNVEVQGVLDTEVSEIQAEVIRFIDHRIEITFPVNPEDIVLGQSITIGGTTFYMTPQTIDNGNILRDGLAVARKIQIQGYIDSQGQAYISKLLNKGAANFNNLSLRGDVASLNNPLFSILSFQVDASNSLIINQGSGVIDVNEFFNNLSEGSQIELKNADFNVALNQFENGNISIQKIQTTAKSIGIGTKEIIGSGIINGFGTATISSVSAVMFDSSFE